jgi:hypothetical protein
VVRVGTDRKLSRWSHYRIREEASPSHWEMWSDEGPARTLLEQIAADPDPGGVPSEMLKGRRLGAPKVPPGLDASTLEKLRALGYVDEPRQPEPERQVEDGGGTAGRES